MRSVSIVLFALYLIAPGASATTAGARRTPIFGAYQHCPFHCIAIQIRPDNTFVYRLDGDLYKDQRVVGRWTYAGRNMLRATSPGDTSPPSVVESATAPRRGIAVRVVDANGAAVSDVELSCATTTVRTDATGSAELPVCEEIGIRYEGYRGTHRLKDPKANQLDVTLTATQMSALAIDQLWRIEGRRLFVANADGTFDRSRPFTRLSARDESRIFGR